MTNTKLCGFIMPISAIGHYTAEHWSRIKKILASIVTEAFAQKNIVNVKPEVVSTDFSALEIKSVIFNNLFSIPIVICDVSGNNPNVLYELGLRIAFDMPVIIVKDKRTDFNFDINSLLTIVYPDDLDALSEQDGSYQLFHTQLLERIVETYEAYKRGSTEISPLGKYLDHHHYLQIKRGVPFDISGQYEYKCYRDEDGYCHGGKCNISLRHTRGNLVEWQLKGERCWLKENSGSPIQWLNNPYVWETKKAILFEDKTYVLNYEIETASVYIKGFIKGEIHLKMNSNLVDKFSGSYYQDEGSRVLKGRFVMERRTKTLKIPDFKLLP